MLFWPEPTREVAKHVASVYSTETFVSIISDMKIKLKKRVEKETEIAPNFLWFYNIFNALPGVDEIGLVGQNKRVLGTSGVERDEVFELKFGLLDRQADASEQAEKVLVEEG
jgi:hypothetical protein